jgi:hypothetical protein
MTKLLANADRVGTKPYKDIFDLVVMFGSWGAIPVEAFTEAYSHYGKKIVDQALLQALLNFSENTDEYAKAAKNMSVDARYFKNDILPCAQKMLECYSSLAI